MRLLFAGTPEAAVPSLAALAESGHEIAAVVTRPDAPLGRKRVLTPSPVAAAAAERGLEVVKAARLDPATSERLLAYGADLGVVVAYGGLVRQPLLDGPRFGWINLHFSLLPRWRGAAPVQHALLAGDARTAASVFRLVAELDAGAVYAARERALCPDETAGAVLTDLAGSGALLLRETVDRLAAGPVEARAQAGEVTLAPKLTLEDARLDWSEPAERVYARLRAVTPEPGAFTTVDGTRFKVLEARLDEAARSPGEGRIDRVGDAVLAGTAEGALRLVTVQPAGKRPMAALAWWRGRAGSGPAVAE